MGKQAGPPPLHSAVTGAPPRVLIADPDPAGEARLRAILGANGIPAEAARTPEEALAATGVDAVLLSLDGPSDERLAR